VFASAWRTLLPAHAAAAATIDYVRPVSSMTRSKLLSSESMYRGNEWKRDMSMPGNYARGLQLRVGVDKLIRGMSIAAKLPAASHTPYGSRKQRLAPPTADS
jgi:hypothetical protein